MTLEEMYERLDKMWLLEKGWDSYEADPPSDKAINIAKTLVQAAAGCGESPTFVAPSVMGVLEWAGATVAKPSLRSTMTAVSGCSYRLLTRKIGAI